MSSVEQVRRLQAWRQCEHLAIHGNIAGKPPNSRDYVMKLYCCCNESSPRLLQEIWNIFTFYSLHGNPLDPEHIRTTQFVKLARDTQIVGTALSEADPPLTDADVQVVYTAEVKNRDRAPGAAAARNGGMAARSAAAVSASAELKKMNYNDFLTALMKLSIRVYPRSRSVDEAFQRLLMDNILPLASRRCPDSVAAILAHPDVSRLFEYYREGLEQVFQFYATSDRRTARALVAQSAAAAASSSSGGFSGTTGPYGLTVAGRSPGRATRGSNTMKEALGYAEFLKFASDFDLSSSVILSTLEIGDIYLSSIKAVEPDSTIRKLTFLEFWEALVRCALVAYTKISDASVMDKIRGLFLYMWRSMHKSVPRAVTERRNVTTYAGDLISGAMLFNKRFTAAWAADGYRDYLSPENRPLESGKAVLSRLLRNGSSSSSGGMDSSSASGTLGGLNLAGLLTSSPASAAAAATAPATPGGPSSYSSSASASSSSSSYQPTSGSAAAAAAAAAAAVASMAASRGVLPASMTSQRDAASSSSSASSVVGGGGGGSAGSVAGSTSGGAPVPPPALGAAPNSAAVATLPLPSVPAVVAAAAPPVYSSSKYGIGAPQPAAAGASASGAVDYGY